MTAVASGQRLAHRLGDAEIDHLDDRPAVGVVDQDVGWLEVAVDDAALMRMLHGVTDLPEELQPGANRQLLRSPRR